MKSDRLQDAIGEVRDDYISDADTMPMKGGKMWVRWGALAAAAVLTVVGLYAINRPQAEPDVSVPVQTETADAQEEPQQTETVPTGGVTIPAVELPEPNQGAMADMLGLVVYHGGIYTQAEMFSGEDAERIEGLLGDYIGHCEGRIDEWSTEEEYQHELASNMYGDVYTVKGYDDGFRICIRNEYEDENGERAVWFEFLERLNGVTLYTGGDLLEDRLHVRERTVSIQWQAHEDWDWNRGNLQDAEIEQSDWDAFLDAADGAEFFSAWNPDEDFYPDHPRSSIYDTPNQAHLILNMDDGTTAKLRLIDGGYVTYYGAGWWYFLKLPADVFDPIYNACGGTHATQWDVNK